MKLDSTVNGLEIKFLNENMLFSAYRNDICNKLSVAHQLLNNMTSGSSKEEYYKVSDLLVESWNQFTEFRRIIATLENQS